MTRWTLFLMLCPILLAAPPACDDAPAAERPVDAADENDQGGTDIETDGAVDAQDALPDLPEDTATETTEDAPPPDLGADAEVADTAEDMPTDTPPDGAADTEVTADAASDSTPDLDTPTEADAPDTPCGQLGGTCRTACLAGEVDFEPATCAEPLPVCCLPETASDCPPECQAIGTRSEGWYWACGDGRIRYDFCEDCSAVCLFDGTDREGWYSSCDGDVITTVDCK